MPIGISDDELDYVFNAKAVFLTGRDITGTWNPLSFTTPPLEVPKGEIPYLLVAPFIGPLQSSLFNARLPYALFNTLFVVVLFLLAYKLFGRGQAIITGLVAAVNPYMIYFGRTAFDAPLASMFYFLALLILLTTNGWKILFAFPTLFLAFYSYVGTKLIFIPFSLLIIIYSWLFIKKKKYTKQHSILALLVFATFAFYVINLQSSNSVSRLSELATPAHQSISAIVDEQRRLSVETPVQYIFSNKLTAYLRQSLEKYLGAFSTQFLFLYGDVRSTFSVWQHGTFYYLDFFFLLIGIYAMYNKNRKTCLLFLTLTFIAPLPSVASNVGTTYPIRATLLFPTLILFIGYGIWQTFNSVKLIRYKLFASLIIAFLYIILITNFLYIYLFRNPIYNSEGFNFSARILSRYIELAKEQGENVTLIVNTNNLISSSLFKQHLFYMNGYDKETAYAISHLANYETSKYENLEIGCPEEQQNNTIIIIPNSKCMNLDKNPNRLTIAYLSDGGEIYKIFNDRICKKYRLNRYPAGIKLQDFEVEKLSEREFCQNFITNYNPSPQSSLSPSD